MTQHEEDRALDVFSTALESYRRERQTVVGREAVRVALRAAFVDYEARAVPRERVARNEKPRPLLEQSKALVLAVCTSERAQVAVVCSFDRVSPGSGAVNARGILVGILSDAGLSPRDIAEGLGMSASTVGNLKTLRGERPAWEAKIARFRSLLG